MNSNDSKDFELDEPAAKSHTPPGWPIHTIELVPSGKAPKKYGPTTYRFGAVLTLSVILPRRGWTLVKKTKNYAYFIPPSDQSSPPFKISIAVPTAEEVLALVHRSYAKGQSWMGQLGEWPAWYLHERNTDMQEMWRDPGTGLMASRLHKNPPKSSLTIGQWGVWEANATGVGGEFVLGVLPPSLVSAPAISAPAESTVFEGASTTVELTLYERNATARKLCIAHYGPTCQACGLNYEEKYGAIGADLIHVHHVTPLSAIGEAYQVDPIRDLIPLCATCHHVVHRRDPPYSVAEMRAAITAQAARKAGGDRGGQT
ncbi:HNH endonuclease [uncultured Xanthomonas sp.]|uniref:HNH endonuclease n=1 Tax=uncultured Xanthomonas sp. TaxID=152831 RepID=UPI0025D48DC9|nr:HNH endonuclease [uncultured Xanthomonas sp.]